jgi:hypothetical protein
MYKTIVLVATVIISTSCMTQNKRFATIEEGMTQDKVKEIMAKPPTNFHKFNDQFVSWNYGENRCVLFKDAKVLSTSRTVKKTILDVPFYQKDEITMAACNPEGKSNTVQVESIGPGWQEIWMMNSTVDLIRAIGTIR